MSSPGSGRSEEQRPHLEDAEGGSDLALLRAHVQGDPQAFNEIVRRHRRALWATAMRVLSDHHDAQDAVQTALLAAFHRAHTYRGEGDVLSWLRVIVENTSRTSATTRRRPGRAVVDLASDDGEQRSTTDSDEDSVDHEMVLREFLKELPEEQRRAFFLVRMHGYSMTEAADIESVALGTIKSRVARARARLGGRLGELRETGNL